MIDKLREAKKSKLTKEENPIIPIRKRGLGRSGIPGK